MKKHLSVRVLSLLLCVCLLLTIFAGLTLVSAQTGTLVKNDKARHITCTALSSQAQAYYTPGTNDYGTIMNLNGVYAPADSWAVTQKNPIYTGLQTLMKDTHTNQSVVYAGTGSTALATYWASTDAAQGTGSYLFFYSDIDSADSGQSMDREHVWPQSKADYFQSSGTGGADLHHLRPSIAGVNRSKSNNTFANLNGTGSAYSVNGEEVIWVGNSKIEVRDNIKGDVARILLYVFVRWGEPNLYTSYDNISEKLKTAGINTTGTIDSEGDDGTNAIESLDTLLQWCHDDPVDTWEMMRNDQIENVQGNRNVFIDYPEFAWMMFGMDVPDDMPTPSGYAINGYTPPVYNWRITNASVSNQNYGSVTVTGANTVSVTLQPDCYIANVTASSGTPVINGNVITVNNMTYDCTVTVILGKRYTVTLNDRGSITTQTCDVGDRITLPTGSGVSGFTFAGWVEQAIPGESATKPTILTGEYEPTATCTLYALYSRTSGGANGYTLSTEAPAAGETVILARLVDGTYYAMTTSQTPGSSQITLTNGTVSDTSSILWDVVSGSNNTVRLKPSGASNYLHFNSGALKIANGTQNSDIIFTNTGNGTYTAKLNSDSYDRAIISKKVDNAETGFGCGASASALPLSIFKYSAGTTSYTTNPSNPSCTHTNTTITGAVSATCTVPGYTGDTVCLSCGTTVSTGSVIPAKGHTSVSVAAVAATCEEPGHNSGTRCSVCLTVLTGLTEIPAKGHNYIGTITKAATCTEDGVKTYTCSRSGCGSSYTETIDRLGHNYSGAVTTAATCGKDGVMTYTCSRCKNSYTDVIPATGNHSYNNGVTTTAATCTAPGIKTFTCSGCGDFYTQPIDALGHNYEGKVTTAATCGKDGVMTYTCSRCPDSYTDVIPATGNHNYSSSYVSKSATCTQDGERTYTCSVCWGTKTEKIAALGHTYSDSVTTPATCTTDGIRTYTCTRCYKDSYTEVIPMTGHNLGKATNNYNRTYHTYYCQNSGCSYSVQEAHNFAETVSGTLRTYTCTLCGYSYSSYLSTYTVTYIDPLKTSSVNVTEGSSTTPPATASAIDGYTFAGWSFDELSDEDTSATLQTTSFKPTANVTLYAVYSRTEDVSGECTYTIVTNKNQLVSGKNVIITAKDYDYAVGDVLNNYYRDQVAVIKDVDEIIAGSDIYPFTLGSLSNSQWSLFDVKNNSYLTAYVSGSYYDLGTETALSDNGKFTFTISPDGTAGISTNNGSCNLVYLTGTYTDFGCKGSSSDGYACSLYIETPATYYTTDPHIPQTYTVYYSALGRIVASVPCTEGSSVTLPNCTDEAENYTFVGWSEEQIDPENTEATVLEVGTTYQPKNSIILYAVYSRIEEGQEGPATLVKMNAGDTLKTGDKIVVIANGTNYVYVMYQQTRSGTYVMYKDFTNDTLTAKTVAEDDKYYFDVTQSGDGWILGDATNGYLYNNSSNNLACNTENSSVFTLTDNKDGTFYLKIGNKWLTSRTDLTTGNANYWRLNSGTGSKNLDLYKFTPGAADTTYYTTNPTSETPCTHESTTLTGYLAATCTADGYTGDEVCDECGVTVTTGEVIPMLGHDIVTDAAVAATCTESGLTEGHHCSRCDGDTLAQEIIPVLGHTCTKVVLTVPAACTTDGYTTYKCIRCDHTENRDTVTKLGHDRVTDAAVAATCTESGLTEGHHCTRCDGDTLAQEIIPVLGHTCTTVISTVPATCTTDGYTTYKCIRCDHTENRDTVTKLGHDRVTDAVVAATCTATGLTAGYHCSRCDGDTLAQEIIPVLGHTCTKVVLTVPAACTTDGYTTYKCIRCDHTENRDTVTKLGHDRVTDAAVAATCTATGLTEGHHCTRCDDDTLAQVVIPKLGHDLVSDEIILPTCTKDGYTHYICSRCDYTENKDTVLPLGHDRVTDAAVAATCTETGLTEGYHCSRCDGDTLAQEVIPALGHHYVNGICVCGAVKMIESAALVLNNDIDLSYTVTVPETATDVYMVFTLNGKDITVPDDGSHTFLFEGVNPQCMGDNVSATLYATVDGKEVTDAQPTYSVLQYCRNKLADESISKELRILLSDMLVYGTAAQNYVSYKTETPVSEDSELVDLTPSTIDGMPVLAPVFEGTAAEDIFWKSVGLTLTNNVAMNFTFYAESVDGLSVTVAISGRTETYTDFTAVEGKANTYRLTFTDITAAEFDEDVTATFYRSNAQIGNSLTYRVNTYICAKQNDGNTALAALVKALYNYGASAKTYAESNKK